MTRVDREIALALLKRLWQRELITETLYLAARGSRLFDSKNFADGEKPLENALTGKEKLQNEHSENP
ncbi:MAG: hypothetical protein RSB53_01605 [Oscillospiraceae bacterium]